MLLYLYEWREVIADWENDISNKKVDIELSAHDAFLK